MMKLVRVCIAGTLLVLCWLAIAASPPPSPPVGQYAIGATLIHSGAVFGKSLMTVDATHPQIATKSGDPSYSLRLKVVSVTQDTLGIALDLTSSYGNISSLASLHKNTQVRFSGPGVELDLITSGVEGNTGFLGL